MASGTPDPQTHELVIIRRRGGGDDDGHHGGVWKIAFADFMTAMMAFFLVMWLINAANEETKQAVASYFNPVRLAHLNTKGLEDPKVVDPGPTEAEKETEKPSPRPDQMHEDSRLTQKDPRYSEQALFRDPYAVLSEIAGGTDEAGRPASPGGRAEGGGGNPTGLNGGEAFRDPFDPAFWQDVASAGDTTAPSDARDPSAAPAAEAEGTPAAIGGSLAAGPSAPVEPAALSPPTEPAAPVAPAPSMQPASPAPEAAAAPEAARDQLARDLEEALSDDAASPNAPAIEVTNTGEGVLISLTDDAAFGMFAIGSAEPRPELIRIMEKIAGLLKNRPGDIVIRGHTDARPFRTENYDNWRLSSARAQMAYYMLVRGGLDEKRVEQIEGHADRALRLPGDPEAAANRRIEILVREPAT